MTACLPIFRKVEQIDRRHTNARRFPEDALRHRSKLKVLLLDGNHITRIPPNVSTLTKLERLSIGDNELESVPAELFRLGHLQELSLRGNAISVLPSSLKGCKALMVLDLSCNQMNTVPESIADLTHLTSLTLNDCTLHRLPPQISGLKNLQVLEARDNHIKYLPSTISSLRQLRKLDVGCNDITELPAGIGSLTLLEELWVDMNDMEALPVEIGALEQLKVADFSENHIEALPPDLQGLTNLTDLIMSNNIVHALPDSIGSLRSLTQLKCEHNQIMHLPDSIGELKNVKELFLSDNMIEHIPGTIGGLVKLNTLYIDRNHLASVPPELCCCKSLSILSLRQNSLTRIPPDYGLMSSLKIIDLCNNRLETLPYSFLQLDLRALWLSDNQSKALMELQEEADPVTKQLVLTCVLLPQPTGQSQSLENLLNLGNSSFADPDASSRASQATGGSHEKQKPGVGFTPDTAEGEARSGTKLHRIPTPFVKGRGVRIDGRRSPTSNQRSSTGSVEHQHGDQSAEGSRTGGSPESTDSKAKHVAFDIKDTTDGGSGSRLSSRQTPPQPSSLAKKTSGPEGNEAAILDNNEDETSAIPTKVNFEAAADDEAGEKRVSFVASDEKKEEEKGGEEEEQTGEDTFVSKLSRKDTPKPKVYTGADQDSKLRRRDTPRNFGTPNFGKSSPGTAMLEEANEEEEEEEMRRIEEEAKRKAPAAAPAEPGHQDIDVTLHRKAGSSLGFSISGGADCTPPYRPDNDFVYISKINPGGLAHEDGRMQRHDQIMSVDGHDFTSGISHEDAVSSLKATGTTVTFVLRRELPVVAESAPVIQITSASLDHPDEEDDFNTRTDTPPTPEESKKPLFDNEEKLPDGAVLVTIDRGTTSLGMTIVGGNDTSPLPFGSHAKNDEGVYISKVVAGGLAAESGELFMGDQIMSVNGQDFTSGISHSNAVACLIGSSKVKMVIKHRGPPPGISDIIFEKTSEEKLGLSIRGGSGAAKSGNPYDDRDEGIFISRINPGGAAHRTGKFRVGQRILDVNGNTLLGAAHHEAVLILKGVGNPVKFVVCDGFDPPEDDAPPSLDASIVSKSAGDASAVSAAAPLEAHPEAVQVSSQDAPAIALSTVEMPASEQPDEPVQAESSAELPEHAAAPSTEESAPEDLSVPVDVPALETTTAEASEATGPEPEAVTAEADVVEATAAAHIEEEAPEAAGQTQDVTQSPAEESVAANSEQVEPAEEGIAATAPPADEQQSSPSDDKPPSSPENQEHQEGVEIGGHNLRSTPIRDATKPAEGDAAAEATGGDGEQSSPKKKHKKHKKHKKSRKEDEGGEESRGRRHRHRGEKGE